MLIGFDLETARDFPENIEWSEEYHEHPLGVSCAASCDSNLNIKHWYHGQPNNPLPGAMTMDELNVMVDNLLEMNQSHQIVTWNGLSFDFNLLARETGRFGDIKTLALEHIDMMFQVVCIKGFRLSLNVAAKGMGLEGKMESVGGELAPKMWAESEESRKKVLEYVDQDARVTVKLAVALQEHKRLEWISKSGRLSRLPFPDGLLSVQECIKLPKPDTSWMTVPTNRENYYAWINDGE